MFQFFLLFLESKRIGHIDVKLTQKPMNGIVRNKIFLFIKAVVEASFFQKVSRAALLVFFSISI